MRKYHMRKQKSNPSREDGGKEGRPLERRQSKVEIA